MCRYECKCIWSFEVGCGAAPFEVWKWDRCEDTGS